MASAGKNLIKGVALATLVTAAVALAHALKKNKKAKLLKAAMMDAKAAVVAHAKKLQGVSKKSYAKIVDTVMAAGEGEITLCTLGPLTNVAMALIKQPAIAGRLRHIVMMGGAYFEVGNITPAAEFNIYVDPHAADVVFRSGIPLTVAPLDLTHRMPTTEKRRQAFAAIGNRTGEAVAGLLSFSERFDLTKYGSIGAPLHDPCVIAWLLQPDLFTGRDINVSIETVSELTMGMTVADWWRVTDRPANALFLRDGNADGYYQLLTERLARLP